MKSQILTLFFITLVFTYTFSGCNEEGDNLSPSNGETSILSVELESHFENDDVYVILDDKNLLYDNITTNYTVSAAWLSGPLDCSRGSHRLVVGFTDNSLMAEYDFDITDTLTVCVRYSVENNEFRFFEYSGMILRD